MVISHGIGSWRGLLAAIGTEALDFAEADDADDDDVAEDEEDVVVDDATLELSSSSM